MPVDIRNILGNVISFVKSKANQVCASTCDGLVLRMHYRWTFCVLMGCFMTVWYSWYHRDVITCVSHFNSEAQVRLDYINICLSYPFKDEEGSRRYLLFYRWISWSLLVLAFVYYVPRKMSKSFDNPRCKKLIEDLAVNSHRYDVMEKELVKKAAQYMLFNIRTHNALYWKYLLVNFVSLAVDIFAMHYFNFILQGRFIQYGIKAYPFSRDPQTFTDYISQTFPPFASCELADVNQIVNKRTEQFGCHLTIMELYEKVFFGLWFWLIVLLFVTCCYIIFLITLWVPFVQVYLLRAAKPAHVNDKVKDTVSDVLKNCKIGDIYLLYRLKSHLSHARYYEVLKYLSDPRIYNKQDQTTESVVEKDNDKMSLLQQDSLRNRVTNAQTAPVSALYPQHMLTNQVNLGLSQQNPETRPLLQENNNIRIPIE